MKQYLCNWCGGFVTEKGRRKYCSTQCLWAGNMARWREKNREKALKQTRDAVRRHRARKKAGAEGKGGEWLTFREVESILIEVPATCWNESGPR